jgi:hypothetical protein
VHQPGGLFEATAGNQLCVHPVLTPDLHQMRFDVS